MKVGIHLLHKNPWNPNVVNPINQEKLMESLTRDGQIKPLIIRETDDGFQIIDGQHRWEAAKALGWDEVEAVNLGRLSDQAAKKATLLANSRYGEDDNEALAALLASGDVGTAEEIINTMPIDMDEIANFFAHSNDDIDFAALDEDEPEDAKDDPGLEIEVPGSRMKTHQILRFKLDTASAEELSSRLAEIAVANKLDDPDKLVNQGEALLILLGKAK